MFRLVLGVNFLWVSCVCTSRELQQASPLPGCLCVSVGAVSRVNANLLLPSAIAGKPAELTIRNTGLELESSCASSGIPLSSLCTYHLPTAITKVLASGLGVPWLQLEFMK